jgi:hypothetical protein
VIETTVVTQRRGNRKMLYLFEQYKAAHPDEGNEINPHLVAPWAIAQGLWKRPPQLRVTPERPNWDLSSCSMPPTLVRTGDMHLFGCSQVLIARASRARGSLCR